MNKELIQTLINKTEAIVSHVTFIEIADLLLSITESDYIPYDEKIGQVRGIAQLLKKGEYYV